MDIDYVKFFLNSKSSIVLLELVEISHPDFSETFRVVRNATRGITVTHEDASVRVYTYYPLKIQPSAALSDLDYGIQVEFGDLGGNLQIEVDAIAEAGGFSTKPVLTLRGYRSDDLTQPIHGPQILEVNELAFNQDGAQFDAVARLKNVSATGRIYNLNDFPMLRGLL